jgi:hypothetical protein
MMGFLRRSRKTVLIILLTVLVTLTLVFLVSSWFNLHDVTHFLSSGSLRTINVKAYWNESHTNEINEINWGTAYLGSSHNATVFLQSTSNVGATFELITANWTFLNSHSGIALGPINETPYINLTWNYTEKKVNPNETVKVTLTLNVSNSPDFVQFIINNDVREFNVDIVIRAVESP